MIAPILLSMFVLGWLSAVAVPQGAIGKAFRRLFVDAPARLLQTSPRTAAVWLVLLVLLLAISIAAPEVIALMGVSDLSAYLDLALISLVLGAVKSARSLAGSALAIARQGLAALAAARPAAGRRGGRVRRVRKARPPPPAEGGFGAGAWVVA